MRWVCAVSSVSAKLRNIQSTLILCHVVDPSILLYGFSVSPPHHRSVFLILSLHVNPPLHMSSVPRNDRVSTSWRLLRPGLLLHSCVPHSRSPSSASTRPSRLKASPPSSPHPGAIRHKRNTSLKTSPSRSSLHRLLHQQPALLFHLHLLLHRRPHQCPLQYLLHLSPLRTRQCLSVKKRALLSQPGTHSNKILVRLLMKLNFELYISVGTKYLLKGWSDLVQTCLHRRVCSRSMCTWEWVCVCTRCSKFGCGCFFSSKNRPHRSSREDYFLFLSPSLQLFCIATGTMDEVLASLQRGQIQLRKVSHHRMAPPAADQRSDLMSAIRQGVTLKKVRSSSKPNTTFADISFMQHRKRQRSFEKDSFYIKIFEHWDITKLFVFFFFLMTKKSRKTRISLFLELFDGVHISIIHSWGRLLHRRTYPWMWTLHLLSCCCCN